MITIPQSFELMGHTITVEYDRSLVEKEQAFGVCYPASQTIRLQPPCKEITKAFVLQTFLHECVHLWCYFVGRMDLYSDEAFVDSMANCIMQMLKTKSGKPNTV